MIHSIESKSPVDRDGRLQVNDRIHEVNGLSLVGLDFTRSVAITLTFVDLAQFRI